MVDVRPLASSELHSVASVLGLARLHQGDGFYLVAWRGNEPLGHVHLALTDPPELQDVYVRVERRRQGVGTALLGRAEDDARARGFDRVGLGVSVDGVAAQAFYRRCGYIDSGDAPRSRQGQARSRYAQDSSMSMTRSSLWEKRLSDSVPATA
jgi:ribosomal protein S18 acetylase RimI-like enzyme